MNLNRRNVLAGLGAAAVGTGAAFGSGAFTQISAERDVEIRIASDDDGMVQLETNSTTSDYVFMSDGQLAIDLPDLNQDTVVDLDAPFSIANNSDAGTERDPKELEIELSVDDDDWTSALTFQALNEDIEDNSEGDTDITEESIVLAEPEQQGSDTDISIEIDTEVLEEDDEVTEATFEVSDAS